MEHPRGRAEPDLPLRALEFGMRAAMEFVERALTFRPVKVNGLKPQAVGFVLFRRKYPLRSFDG